MRTNGHDHTSPAEPAAGPSVGDQVAAAYPHLATQLGAINTLLAALPLQEMLAANAQLQRRAALELPAMAQTEYQAALGGLRGDAKIIDAALRLQRTIRAVAQQPPATR